ncbi:MAG: peptidase inhibitor family I36 protein [Egibacteraceae bacterium]
MKRIFASVILITIVAAGVGVVGVATAHSQEDCLDGEVCLYDGTFYSGLLGSSSETASYVGDVANDRATSVINYTSFVVVLYSDANYGGFEVCLEPGFGYDDLSVVGLDDDISSFAVGGVSCS